MSMLGMTPENQCPLSGDTAPVTGGGGDPFDIDCPVCGHFQLDFKTFFELRTAGAPFSGGEVQNRTLADGFARVHGEDNKLLRFLACYTRQWSESGAIVTVGADWRDKAAQHQAGTVRRNSEKLLRHLARHSYRPGFAVELSLSRDWPVIDTTAERELQWHLEHLSERSLISGYIANPPEGPKELELTMSGWALLDPLRSDQIEPGRVFVARSYQEDLDDLFDTAISPAIEEVGGVAVDGKMPPEGEPNREITEHIRSEIVRAEVVIADCSGHRPNVYFEIGYAMGLGRPVILTCRQGDLKSAHFDTRQFHHITWIKREDLQQELPNWLRPRLVHKAPKD